MTTTQPSPTAAGSGVNASQAFRLSAERRGIAGTSRERADRLIRRTLDVGPYDLAGAEVDFWQADADGYYSGFAPHLPGGNLRGVVVAGGEWLDSDIASATKDDLVLDPTHHDNGTWSVNYDFELEPTN